MTLKALEADELDHGEERSSSRRAFLARLAGFALAGLGVALVPAKSARAGGSLCCPDSRCGPNGFLCTDHCGPITSCCITYPGTQCFTTGCNCN
jgi:hypothetical protein